MPSTDASGKSISFEKWINGMSDAQYEDMLDESNPDGFSDAQQEKALNIRTPPTKEEQDDFDAEQEFEEPQEPIEVPSRPTRTTQRAGESGVVEIEIPRGEPRIPTPITPTPITPPPIAQPRVEPPRPPSRTAKLRETIQSAGKFIRRFFRI